MVTRLTPTKIDTPAITLHFLQAHIYTVTPEDGDQTLTRREQKCKKNCFGIDLAMTQTFGLRVHPFDSVRRATSPTKFLGNNGE